MQGQSESRAEAPPPRDLQGAGQRALLPGERRDHAKGTAVALALTRVSPFSWAVHWRDSLDLLRPRPICVEAQARRQPRSDRPGHRRIGHGHGHGFRSDPVRTVAVAVAVAGPTVSRSLASWRMLVLKPPKGRNTSLTGTPSPGRTGHSILWSSPSLTRTLETWHDQPREPKRCIRFRGSPSCSRRHTPCCSQRTSVDRPSVSSGRVRTRMYS